MKPNFILSKSHTTDQFSHIICTNPVAIYALPDFVLISGDPNPDLCERAKEWYRKFENNELSVPKLIPSGYVDALEKVRANWNSIDLAALAEQIGVSVKSLIMCINGEMHGGKTVHLGYRERVRFVEIAGKM